MENHQFILVAIRPPNHTESHRITNTRLTNNDFSNQQFNNSTNQRFNHRHRTLSPNHGRFCRIARLPHEGEDFAANRHASKSPGDQRGSFTSLRFVQDDNSRLTHFPIPPFNQLTTQQFNHRTLSLNRGRFYRIGRLPHEGEDFAANRHAQKVSGGPEGILHYASLRSG